MATYQTWPTLNFAFSDMFAHAVVLLTFYRTSHLKCNFVWPGWRSFVFALRGRGNVLIKYIHEVVCVPLSGLIFPLTSFSETSVSTKVTLRR